MTIKKQYICDLCRRDGTETCNEWRRLSFAGCGKAGESFKLVPLITTESASETIVCAACLATLTKLLARPQ